MQTLVPGFLPTLHTYEGQVQAVLWCDLVPQGCRVLSPGLTGTVHVTLPCAPKIAAASSGSLWTALGLPQTLTPVQTRLGLSSQMTALARPPPSFLVPACPGSPNLRLLEMWGMQGGAEMGNNHPLLKWDLIIIKYKTIRIWRKECWDGPTEEPSPSPFPASLYVF